MSAPSEDEAVDAFERLGLTSYQAKTFIALHQLGTGTARDIARVTDVPRSQVYSVTEDLAERGLIEVQQSSPIRYRAIPLEEAREILRDRFEREQDRAFTYVESVRDEAGVEEREAIWTLRGRRRVDDRVLELISGADHRVVFGVRGPEQVTTEIVQTLTELANGGHSVRVVSQSDAVLDRFAGVEGVDLVEPPEPYDETDRSHRLVVVDETTLLVSVVDDDGEETAIWSERSIFASVLIQLITTSGAIS